MEPKHTLCVMDWRALHQNMNDVVCNRKSQDDIAYLALFGLQKESALPVWFAFNDYWPVPDMAASTALKCMPYVQKAGLVYDGAPPEAHCMRVFYKDIIRRCGFEMNGRVINVETDKALTAFRETFSTHLKESAEALIVSRQRPSLIVL